MILGPREMAWQERVVKAAHEYRWSVFVQSQRNQRQHVPSLVLVRERVLLVYLRLQVRAGRRPPADELAAVTGATAVVWTPQDWPFVLHELLPPDPEAA